MARLIFSIVLMYLVVYSAGVWMNRRRAVLETQQNDQN